MTKKSAKIIRITLGTILGLPPTMSLGLWIITFFFLAFFMVVECLLTGQIFSKKFAELVLFSLWPIAGLIGLVGYWIWLFMERPIGKYKKIIITILIIFGLMAIAPLAIIERLAEERFNGMTIIVWFTAGLGIIMLFDTWFFSGRNKVRMEDEPLKSGNNEKNSLPSGE